MTRWPERLDNGGKYRVVEVYSRDAVMRLNTADRLVPPCEPATLSSCVLIERNGRFATIRSRKHNGQPELLGGKASSSDQHQPQIVVDPVSGEHLDQEPVVLVGCRHRRVHQHTRLAQREPAT
jgi:hypothetical protein